MSFRHNNPTAGKQFKKRGPLKLLFSRVEPLTKPYKPYQTLFFMFFQERCHVSANYSLLHVEERQAGRAVPSAEISAMQHWGCSLVP